MNLHASPPPDPYEWRYLMDRRVTHALKRRNGRLDTVSRCGREPKWFDPAGWLGTGNQQEYERAAQLPKCRRCDGLIRQHG